MTISCSARLVSPSPPMESNVVLISIGFATSHAMMSSYWFVTMLGRPRRRAISFSTLFAAASRSRGAVGIQELVRKVERDGGEARGDGPARSSTRISWPPMRCPPPRGAIPLCWPMQSGRALKCETGEEREVSSFGFEANEARSAALVSCGIGVHIALL